MKIVCQCHQQTGNTFIGGMSLESQQRINCFTRPIEIKADIIFEKKRKENEIMITIPNRPVYVYEYIRKDLEICRIAMRYFKIFVVLSKYQE